MAAALAATIERVLRDPDDLDARGAMQLGAHFAGIAIENSMLGATHACANPLTAHYGTTHGVAIAALLPHVVRWNQSSAGELYRELGDGDLGYQLTRLAEMADFSSGCGSRAYREKLCLSWPRKLPPSGLDGSIRDLSTPVAPWRSTNGPIKSAVTDSSVVRRLLT